MRHLIVLIFSDGRKHCGNQPKIQTKRPNLRVQNEDGMANSEEPDQTAPLGGLVRVFTVRPDLSV